MFLLVLRIKAEAAELTVLSAIGMQSVMEDLGPKFERATGHTLAISFATAGATVKRVQGGETYDVVIIPQPKPEIQGDVDRLTHYDHASGLLSGRAKTPARDRTARTESRAGP